MPVCLRTYMNQNYMKIFKIFHDWYVCLFICLQLAFLKKFAILLQFETYTGCILILPSIKLNWLLCKSVFFLEFSYWQKCILWAYLHILCIDDGVPKNCWCNKDLFYYWHIKCKYIKPKFSFSWSSSSLCKMQYWQYMLCQSVQKNVIHHMKTFLLED